MPIGSRRRVDYSKIGGIVLLLAAIAGLGAFLAPNFIGNRLDGVDTQTFCKTKGDRSITTVILDVTDTLKAVQQQEIKNRLEEIRESTPEFGQLAVFVLGSTTTDLLRPVVSVCNPGNPDDVNSLTTGRKFIALKFKKLFAEPLDQVFASAMNQPDAAQSPIMEAIQASAATTFDAVGQKGMITKRLILVSDMLQNSDAISFYRGAPHFESFQKLAAYRQLRAELSDVDVEVIAIPRDIRAHVSDKELIEFWQGYIADQGGRLEKWKNL